MGATGGGRGKGGNNHKPVPIIEYEFREKKCLQDLSGLPFGTFLAVLLLLSRKAYHGDN